LEQLDNVFLSAELVDSWNIIYSLFGETVKWCIVFLGMLLKYNTSYKYLIILLHELIRFCLLVSLPKYDILKVVKDVV
jgi:hypothetical protein